MEIIIGSFLSGLLGAYLGLKAYVYRQRRKQRLQLEAVDKSIPGRLRRLGFTVHEDVDDKSVIRLANVGHLLFEDGVTLAHGGNDLCCRQCNEETTWLGEIFDEGAEDARIAVVRELGGICAECGGIRVIGNRRVTRSRIGSLLHDGGNFFDALDTLDAADNWLPGDPAESRKQLKAFDGRLAELPPAPDKSE